MGHFDDYTQPTAHSETVSTRNLWRGRGAGLWRAVSRWRRMRSLPRWKKNSISTLAPAEAAPSPEIFEFEDVDRSEPVPQFDYNDYSQARDSSERAYMASPAAHDDRQQPIEADAGECDPTVYQLPLSRVSKLGVKIPACRTIGRHRMSGLRRMTRLEQNDWSEQNDWPAQNNWNARQPVDAPATHISRLSLHSNRFRLKTSWKTFCLAMSRSLWHPGTAIRITSSLFPTRRNNRIQGEPEAPVSEPHLDAPSHAGQGYASRWRGAGLSYYPRSNFAPGVAAPSVLSSRPQLKTPQAPIVQDFVAGSVRPIEDEFSREDDFTPLKQGRKRLPPPNRRMMTCRGSTKSA